MTEQTDEAANEDEDCLKRKLPQTGPRNQEINCDCATASNREVSEASLGVNLHVRVMPPNDPKLNDPAHRTRGLQPERDGRVRCPW